MCAAQGDQAPPVPVFRETWNDCAPSSAPSPSPTCDAMASIQHFLATIDPSITTWLRDEAPQGSGAVMRRRRKPRKQSCSPTTAARQKTSQAQDVTEQRDAASALLMLLTSDGQACKGGCRKSQSTRGVKRGVSARPRTAGGLTAQEVIRLSQERRKAKAKRNGASSQYSAGKRWRGRW